MSQSEFILETKQISKSFGSTIALEKATIRFTDKKIVGLFGRNGAGKTTLLDIISSRIFADEGTVICLGDDIAERPQTINENCCYMPEKHYFPSRFKVKKLLSHASLSFPNYDEQYGQQLCAIFNLNVEQKYEQLSRGHQSVFRIVIGLASRAPITIFDEPVLGLDAVARDRFYLELIEEFSNHPRLFIISTHLIEESADLFNEAIIIKNGKVIRQASVEEMLANVFYVSGNKTKVDMFIADQTVLSLQEVHEMKTAVIEGQPPTEQSITGLSFSSLTMQNLFIHLTDDQNNRE